MSTTVLRKKKPGATALRVLVRERAHRTLTSALRSGAFDITKPIGTWDSQAWAIDGAKLATSHGDGVWKLWPVYQRSVAEALRLAIKDVRKGKGVGGGRQAAPGAKKPAKKRTTKRATKARR